MKRFGNLVLDPATVLAVSPCHLHVNSTGLAGQLGKLRSDPPSYYDVTCRGGITVVADAQSAVLLMKFLVPSDSDNHQPTPAPTQP